VLHSDAVKEAAKTLPVSQSGGDMTEAEAASALELLAKDTGLTKAEEISKYVKATESQYVERVRRKGRGVSPVPINAICRLFVRELVDVELLVLCGSG
jgi:hypothetical protein